MQMPPVIVLALLTFPRIASAQVDDSVTALQAHLNERFAAVGEYDWELEFTTSIVDSMLLLPAEARQSSAPVFKLAKLLMRTGQYIPARAYFAKYLGHPRANENGRRLARFQLDAMHRSDSIDGMLPKLKDPRDGRQYRTVKIGTQTWMAENLAWNAPGSICSGAEERWCRTYGRYYDLATARSACMPGWHLPSSEDWDRLLEQHPDPRALKGPELGGSNASGFHALPGGTTERSLSRGMPHFETWSRAQAGYFWEDLDTDNALNCRRPSEISDPYGLEDPDDDIGTEEKAPALERHPASRSSFLNVRCLEGPGARTAPADPTPAVPVPPEMPTVKDPRDGHTYPVLRIGNRYWLGENLAYTGPDGTLGRCPSGNPKECAKGERFYDWSTAMRLDPKFNHRTWGILPKRIQGICPDGWSIPTREDWEALDSVAALSSPKRVPSGTALKSREGWAAAPIDGSPGNGSDPWRFRALPVGFQSGYPGSRLEDAGRTTLFWSASDLDGDKASAMMLSSTSSAIQYRQPQKADRLSVRCVH